MTMLFNETVMVTGVRERGRKVYAADLPCRFVDNGIAATFDEHASASNRREVAIFIRKSDWLERSFSLPQIGDVVTTNELKKFAVRSVNDLGAGIMTMGAVSC